MLILARTLKDFNFNDVILEYDYIIIIEDTQ